jgi:hypothetical protein
MRDNLSVICISLRVGIRNFGNGGDKYIEQDVHGRGTTFEMALVDLSAQLIKLLGDDDVIDTDDVPILEETGTPTTREGSNREVKPHGDKSVCADEPGSSVNPVNASDEDAGKGMEARGDGTSGSRPRARQHSKSGRTATNGCSGRKRSKRTSR